MKVTVMKHHILPHAPLEQLSYNDIAKLLKVSKTTAVRMWLNYCQFATDSKQDPDFRTLDDLRPFFALMAIAKADEAARLMDDYDYLNSLSIAPSSADSFTVDQWGTVEWDAPDFIGLWANVAGLGGAVCEVTK